MPQTIDDPEQRASDCLSRALAALERRTDAPLRLVARAGTVDHETFEFQEASEVQPSGAPRRFFVSVDDVRKDLLVVVMPSADEHDD